MVDGVSSNNGKVTTDQGSDSNITTAKGGGAGSTDTGSTSTSPGSGEEHTEEGQEARVEAEGRLRLELAESTRRLEKAKKGRKAAEKVLIILRKPLPPSSSSRTASLTLAQQYKQYDQRGILVQFFKGQSPKVGTLGG